MANGMCMIADLLTAEGVDLTGWTLNVANDVSADGSAIVGYGGNPDDNLDAWRATYSVVPPALYVFGNNLLGLVGMARRKKA